MGQLRGSWDYAENLNEREAPMTPEEREALADEVGGQWGEAIRRNVEVRGDADDSGDGVL